MPEVDGRQIYHYMRASHPALVKRLILSSGDTVSEENQKFLQETGCLFLPKPFLSDELQRVLSQVSACGMVSATTCMSAPEQAATLGTSS
jgi:hypothetical protein